MSYRFFCLSVWLCRRSVCLSIRLSARLYFFLYDICQSFAKFDPAVTPKKIQNTKIKLCILIPGKVAITQDLVDYVIIIIFKLQIFQIIILSTASFGLDELCISLRTLLTREIYLNSNISPRIIVKAHTVC